MKDRAAIERQMRELWEGRDYKKTATLLLEAYGSEILGYLVSRLRSTDSASEVFSIFIEDVWRGLPRFEWRSSARVWAYTLARHASTRFLKKAQRGQRRNVRLSQVSRLSKLEQKIRSKTLPMLTSEVKSRLAVLRERLPPDDQQLLLLRVRGQLDWREIAQIMSKDRQTAVDSELDREAARLRKRFQLVKERLRKLAREEGLLDES